MQTRGISGPVGGFRLRLLIASRSPKVKWLLVPANSAICSSVRLTPARHTLALPMMPLQYVASWKGHFSPAGSFRFRVVKWKDLDLEISQMNPGCAGFKGWLAVAHDLVTLTCAAYCLLHNLLHKLCTGRHTLSCTLRVISSFGRAYYSTGRSLMSLWLQNHTSHLSLTLFSVI